MAPYRFQASKIVKGVYVDVAACCPKDIGSQTGLFSPVGPPPWHRVWKATEVHTRGGTGLQQRITTCGDSERRFTTRRS